MRTDIPPSRKLGGAGAGNGQPPPMRDGPGDRTVECMHPTLTHAVAAERERDLQRRLRAPRLEARSTTWRRPRLRLRWLTDLRLLRIGRSAAPARPC